jgi:sugar/nucleoside kinase (ribokinase family)
LPAAGELLATDDFLVQPGGCASNRASLLAKLGVQAAVAGRVGDDLFGDVVERGLAARGLDTRAILRTPGRGTSQTLILPVVGDDRRYVHAFGANAELAAADIPEAALAAAQVLYVGGYLILPALRQGELAERFRLAREHGTTVVLDVVAPAGRRLSLEDVRELLPFVDYFVPNDDEALALTGESEPQRQAEVFLEHGAGCAVITMGERGCFARSREETVDLPAPSVDVVEPSGAGDAFDAGLTAAVLEGRGLEESVRFASLLGGSACTALGCYEGVFTRAEAEEFQRVHPLEAVSDTEAREMAISSDPVSDTA